MKPTLKLCLCTAMAAAAIAIPMFASQPSESHPAESRAEPVARVATPSDDAAIRAEGEKRFQANCGRCHQFPHKFSPRVILAVERHMRVRALVTEDDMRVIIRYLTQ